jgi:hypothetical protein
MLANGMKRKENNTRKSRERRWVRKRSSQPPHNYDLGFLNVKNPVKRSFSQIRKNVIIPSTLFPQAVNRWGYYPLILIGSWAFGTIDRIHDFIEPGHKIFWLSVLDVGTASLMVIPLTIDMFFSFYFL